MPFRLATTDPGFERAFAGFLARRREGDAGVGRTVADIIADVRARGDAALIELTRRLDGLELTPGTIRLSDSEIDEIAARVPAEDRAALETAAARIRAYHARQRPEGAMWTDEAGARLGWRWQPIAAAGLYVPGGRAAYPSSVLMNAVPAEVAGVTRRAMVVPAPGGVLNPLVILAARLAGITEIHRIGGAQAVAALAWGTESVAPVDKITGPGNAFVAEAKRQVFGQVGIDMVAGPSEVTIIADASAEPEWLALDLLSQAEHDANAQAVLITDDPALAEAAERAVAARLETLSRAEIARASWQDHGAILTVRSLAEGAGLAGRIAPEHLQIYAEGAEALAEQVPRAGAIFLGPWTPEAVGDYAAGPNHVLPTSGTARFASGLSVPDFMTRTTITGMSPAALGAIGPAAGRLARAEGLEAHALSLEARLARLNVNDTGARG